jgi:hypothetical protein
MGRESINVEQNNKIPLTVTGKILSNGETLDKLNHYKSLEKRKLFGIVPTIDRISE